MSEVAHPPVRHRRRRPRYPLPLETTAALAGEYRWIENALYRLLGEWVIDMPIPAVQLHLDAQSMRHAWHADLWAERLPVLAGVDPDGLTAAVRPDHGALRRPVGDRSAHRRPRVGMARDRRGRVRAPGRAAPAGRPVPGGAAPAGDELRTAPAGGQRPDRRPGGPGSPVWSSTTRSRTGRPGSGLVERLVSRPHDVAAVYGFLQRLESQVVGAGASSGLVAVPGPVPGE